MKVLKKGALPETKVYQVECNHCGTVVEFQRGEARYSVDQRDGDALVVDCPTCQRQIWTAA